MILNNTDGTKAPFARALLVLAVTGLGSSLLYSPASAGVPLPAIKPAGPQQQALSEIDIPAPPPKPAATGQSPENKSENKSFVERLLSLAATGGQDIKQSTEQTALAENVPMPAPKPYLESGPAPENFMDLSEQLLSYGESPRPSRRPMPPSGSPVAADDAALYRQIFALQSEANWDEADKLIAQLGDLRLRGHILFQRYMHPTAYRTSFDELAGWMDLYADLPGAHRIYRLAVARKPASYSGAVRAPVQATRINGLLSVLSEHQPRYQSTKQRSAAQNQAVDELARALRRHLSRGQPSAALALLQDSPARTYMDNAEYDQFQARIANSYMLLGELDQAMALCRAAHSRSGTDAPEAGWVGGLVAWQQGHYDLAAGFFETAAASRYNSNWSTARSAYWTSRALLRSGRAGKVSHWLREAAAHPRTFYGLIATRALGWDFDFNWDMPAFTSAHRKALMKNEAALRAQALVEAGQYHLAEAELLRVNPGQDAFLREALLAYAHHHDLPALAMRIAQGTAAPDGRLYDAALYPLAPWEPESGYKIDRALIHALIRQESRFDPYAESHSGATGLMQLMPATASYVAGTRSYKDRAGRHSLKNPQVNLDLGQRYVQNLLSSNLVSSELFSLATAYNAGPGNLAGWKRKNTAMMNDPLLFIETVPMAETRDFVEKIMANYWIYRLRMNQQTPSLDAVIAGKWPPYVRMDDNQSYRVADSR